MARALTHKQQAFAVAVAKGVKGSDAYRASHDAKNMSAKAIKVEASRLLARPNVALTVEKLRAPALVAAGSSVERTMQEVAAVGYADPKADGEIIKYSEKLTALEMLMKHHGLYKNDNKQRAPNLAIQIVYK